mgnify:CR=1 FL=1
MGSEMCIRDRNYSTSFSKAVRLLDPSYRDGIYAIYGFVRLADEVVDTFYGHDQQRMLENIKQDVFEAIKEGVSTNPLIHSFQLFVNRYGIPQELINSFLQSMEMDLHKNNYNADEYQTYIYGSAEVVGLMCLMVFCSGNVERYMELKAPAQKLGRALQKINFLRDLKDDYQIRGRVYFPNVNFDSFTVDEKRIIEGDIQAELKGSLEGINALPRGARAGVYLAYLFFSALLKRIRRIKASELMQKRIRISNSYKLILLVRVYLKFVFTWDCTKPLPSHVPLAICGITVFS